MAFARSVLSATLALSLVACGGGGGSSSAPPTGGTPTPPSSGGDTCSLANRQQFVRDVLNEEGPGVAISVHGSACDLAGVESCVLRVDLSGDTPQVVETIAGADADALIEALGGVGPVE